MKKERILLILSSLIMLSLWFAEKNQKEEPQDTMATEHQGPRFFTEESMDSVTRKSYADVSGSLKNSSICIHGVVIGPKCYCNYG